MKGETKMFFKKNKKDKVKNWLDSMNIKHYTINSNLTVDVNGDIKLSDKNLINIPIKFGKVTGNFYCDGNELTSLKNVPIEVGKNFDCSYNKLTSLKGSPKEIGGTFKCVFNKLTTLKGSPDKVGKHFDCSYNLLENLKGVPKEIGGNFKCIVNVLSKNDVLNSKISEKVSGKIICDNA